MNTLGPKYLKILKVELEDMVEDINSMMEIAQKRKESGEITNYVFWENGTVLIKEISGINNFLQGMSDLDFLKYENLEEMVEDLAAMFRKRTREYDFPEYIYDMVKRKLVKVSLYLCSNQG